MKFFLGVEIWGWYRGLTGFDLNEKKEKGKMKILHQMRRISPIGGVYLHKHLYALAHCH